MFANAKMLSTLTTLHKFVEFLMTDVMKSAINDFRADCQKWIGRRARDFVQNLITQTILKVRGAKLNINERKLTIF